MKGLVRRWLGLEEKAGVQWVGSPGWTEVFQLSGSSRTTTDTLTRSVAFGLSAYLYTIMRWRAQRVAEPPLMVVQETDDGEEWLPDHPLAMLFNQPRPDLDMGELLERTQMYRDLTGAALWVLDRARGTDVTMLTPYSGSEFTTEAVGPVIYGRYRLNGAGQRTYTPEEVTHFRETNPMDWRNPVSRVDVALMQLDLGHNVARITRQFLTKALFPGGIISPDKEWHPTEAEWEHWKAQVAAWHLGPANQGTPLMVPGSTTISTVAVSMKDLLPDAILNRAEATIGGVFGVPPVVMGWLSGLENSPWSQMSEARRQVYEDTIVPIWRDVERRLTRSLLSSEEQAAGLLVRFDTSKVLALKADVERQSRIAALNVDTWTVNERRLATGQEPLPPGDERGQEIVGLRPMPDPSLALGSEPPADAGKAAKASSDTKDLLWLLFDLSTKAGERSWERDIHAILRDQQAAIVAQAKRMLVEGKAATPESLGAFRLWLEKFILGERDRMIAKVNPLILGTGTTAVKRLGARLNLSFGVLQPGLLSYAKREAAFLATTMGETTGKAVAGAVQAGLEAGETISGLVTRLQELPAFDRQRAKLVARTETTRAWNGAQLDSLKDYEQRSGRQATKSWLSARDDRVRDEHAALDDGTFIPIDQAFGNGLQAPGEPNCRCTLLYGFAEE